MDPTTTDVLPHSPSAQVVKQPHSTARLEGNDPTVILILGWMGAKMSNLKKYVQVYEQMYPSSPHFIVRADQSWYWQDQNARERNVLPAAKRLEDLGLLASDKQQTPRVLIHLFSNGGACSLVDLASVLSKRRSQQIIAKSAIIFDSSPGGGTLFTANRSFTAGIRNPAAKYLGMVVVSLVYFVMLSYRVIFGLPHPFKRMLEDLNKPDLLPWTSHKTPRLYLYSAGDKIVEEHVVEEEAAKAKRAGFPVELVHFGKSGHVAHARDHPDKYWDTVRAFWDQQ